MRKPLVALSLVAAVLVAGCTPSGPLPPPAQASRSQSPELPSDPLVQMSIAFEGNPSPKTIQALLDPAFDATNTEINDENYSRAGSVLVSFRQKYGSKEMTILRCMPSRVDDPRLPELSFPNVAAVCNVDIVQGVYVED